MKWNIVCPFAAGVLFSICATVLEINGQNPRDQVFASLFFIGIAVYQACKKEARP